MVLRLEKARKFRDRCNIPNCKRKGLLLGLFGSTELRYCEIHEYVGYQFINRVKLVKEGKSHLISKPFKDVFDSP